MKRITIHDGAYVIERPGRAWAKLVTGILLAPWVLCIIWALFTETSNPWMAVIGWTLAAFVPAAVVKYMFGSTARPQGRSRRTTSAAATT